MFFQVAEGARMEGPLWAEPGRSSPPGSVSKDIHTKEKGVGEEGVKVNSGKQKVLEHRSKI